MQQETPDEEEATGQAEDQLNCTREELNMKERECRQLQEKLEDLQDSETALKVRHQHSRTDRCL